MDILGISGSLRKDSYNTRLLSAAGVALAGRATLRIFDLSEVPLYNGDLDGDRKPAPVLQLQGAIAAADALLFATPEYNYSVPGVLKNAIDWASRPAYESVLRGKPSGIMSASPSSLGGARAQIHLRAVLAATLTPVFPAPEVLLASAHKAFDDSGKLVDEATAAFLAQYLNGYVEWAAKR